MAVDKFNIPRFGLFPYLYRGKGKRWKNSG
jgi:hypothetical protein